MKLKLFVTLLLIVPFASGVAQQSSLTLERVGGLYEAGELPIDQMVTFYIRITNAEGLAVKGITNGFRIYSEDGVEWDTTTGDTLGTLDWAATFPIAHYIDDYFYSVTGSGADTIGFSFVSIFSGLPVDFDDTAYTITIGPIAAAHHGKTICLDSSFYPPSGVWKWAVSGTYQPIPDWDGPHCYTVVDPASCCHLRGDINHDGAEIIDISDLLYLVYYMFRDGPPPVCMAEADITGDNALMPDIADLVYLIDYMFRGGPPPMPCYPEPHSLIGEYNGIYSVTSDYGTPWEQVHFNWVNFAFFEETYLIEIDVENNTGMCFCRAGGLYAVSEGVQFQERHSQPFGPAGCQACDDEYNPTGIFSRQYLSDTLVLKQMMGTTLKELRLVKTSADMSSRQAIDPNSR